MRRHPAPPRRRQRGVALIVAMLLLAIMLVMGTTSLETALVEYKIAANIRDRGETFERAEAGTLHSLSLLRTLVASGRGAPGSITGFVPGGELLDVGHTGLPQDTASAVFWTKFPLSRANGVVTPLVDDLVYVIERLPNDDEAEPAGPGTYLPSFNRVTAWSKSDTGANVHLQATLVTLPE